MPAIKVYRTHIVAASLAIFFFVAAHFFLAAYNRYTLNQDRLRISTIQVRSLRRYQREQARTKQILKRVNRFVNRANSLELKRDKWAYYDVNIDEAVSFIEAEEIIGQTANSSSYYFKPVMLHVKTKMESNDKARPDTQTATSADSPETEKGDVFLTLKGTFVVKGK